MHNQDQSIVEEIRSYLGLDPTKRESEQRLDLGSEHIRSYIEDAYRLKAAKFSYHDAIVTAFTKTHHNMYIDDPAFYTTFKKEMTGRGLPKPAIAEALDAVDVILDKAAKEFGSPSSKDGGFHPKLDEIKEISQPEQPDNGGPINGKYGQEANITSDMPIDRTKAKKRGPAVMESAINENRHGRGRNIQSTYNTSYTVELPQTDIEVSVTMSYVASPGLPQTYDSPEEPGEIEVHDAQVVDIETNGDIPISPELQDYVHRDLNDKVTNNYFNEEIGQQLGEREEADRSDYADYIRDRDRDDRDYGDY